MDKTNIATIGILLVVVGSVTGILGNQLASVQGELNDHAKIVYAMPDLKDDIKEIKIEVNDINEKLDAVIISRSQTNSQP